MSQVLQVTPIILHGSARIRLWPLSREGFPKQLLSITSNERLCQQVANRLETLRNSEIQVVQYLKVSHE